MAFHDVRLPDDVERGAVGGPRFRTSILSQQSGFEKRNIDWSTTRGQWDIGYGLMEKASAGNLTDVETVIAFFYARQGRGHSFRFKDWSDFEIGAGVATGQAIGLGDGSTTAFQIYKRYSSGGVDYDRTVNKIVASTYSVYLDGVLQVEGGGNDYTINLTTGIVTFNTAPLSTGGTGPGGEELVSIICEFDNHVRFDTDEPDISMQVFNVGQFPTIPIVELRGTGV